MAKCTVIDKECKFAREFSKKIYCEVHANKIKLAVVSDIKKCPLDDIKNIKIKENKEKEEKKKKK